MPGAGILPLLKPKYPPHHLLFIPHVEALRLPARGIKFSMDEARTSYHNPLQKSRTILQVSAMAYHRICRFLLRVPVLGRGARHASSLTKRYKAACGTCHPCTTTQRIAVAFSPNSDSPLPTWQRIGYRFAAYWLVMGCTTPCQDRSYWRSGCSGRWLPGCHRAIPHNAWQSATPTPPAAPCV
jgi:hypothetical protein